MDGEDKINISWEEDNKGNLVPELDFREDKTRQVCLRCFKKPALKDGTDEGDYYCKNCIIERAKIEKETIEKNRLKEKRTEKGFCEDIKEKEKDSDEELD